jgi:octaprenyl-diphosphate synthase
MSTIDKIKAPVTADLKSFEPYFRSMMKSKAPLLNIITNYIIKRKGKQMRPIFVFLTAKLVGDVNKSSFSAAALIELMHTATLIHDDVVDDSYQRRGLFSINALWKNKIAVLVGDYLLSRGLLLAIDNKEYKLLEIVSEAVSEMSEGELLQIEKARKLDITEEVYFDIIQKKTAALIAACSVSGAYTGGATEEQLEMMKLFGSYTGISFQIKDDIFDYSQSGLIGKPTGNDIKEKKMTLPLIYVLNNCSPGDKKHIIRIIKNKSKDANKVKEVVDFVIKNHGIEYAEETMNNYKTKALDILNQFPKNESHDSLKLFVEYTTTRKK